jgi:16S rRNA (cytidine1402-2'-O)-methyltransferase
MSGTLHLVGTPIGNLGDITRRAVDTLQGVDRIYAEDTRRTRVLLSALGITGKAVSSLHAHSSERTVATALEILQEGRSVAVVTDAGMPSISDPGLVLVRAARAAGIPITAAPGPSAVTTAIALSGLVEGPFLFLGFLPRKGRAHREALARIARSDVPVVFFESPQRASQTLTELSALCPERRLAVCRELTKRFEEVVHGTVSEVAGRTQEWRGELTLVVAPGEGEAELEGEATPREQEELSLDARIDALLGEGHSVKHVVGVLSSVLPALPKRALYTHVQHRHDRRSDVDDAPAPNDDRARDGRRLSATDDD